VITARCTEVDSGARNIDYILTQTVLPLLSSLVLERMAVQMAFSAVHMSVGAGDGFDFAFRDDPLGRGPQ
jgi:type VI secretion system protein VasG